jgi:chromosome segregation ATPase
LEFKEVLTVLNIINICVVPLILLSMKYIINQVSKENVDELRKEIDRKIYKIEEQTESNSTKLDVKLQRIEEKLDRFIGETHNVLQENRIKIAEVESTKTVLNILDREVESNKSEIKKIESSLHQEFREGLVRVHNRLDEIVRSISNK